MDNAKVIFTKEKGFSQFQFNSGHFFMIQKLDYKDPLDLPPHRHQFYEIIWFFEGAGEQRIDLELYPVQANRIFWIKPGQTHHWKLAAGHGYFITFSESLLDPTYQELILQTANLFSLSDNQPVLELNSKEVQKLKPLVNLMLEEYHSGIPDWNVIRPMLCAFLYNLIRFKQSNHSGVSYPQDPRLIKLHWLIEQHYAVNTSANFYASQLNITSKHLSEITNTLLGKTVSGMIQERILLEAKRSLSLSRESVKTIAQSLGFDDPSYFSRVFRQSVGQSPNGFRQAIQQISH